MLRIMLTFTMASCVADTKGVRLTAGLTTTASIIPTRVEIATSVWMPRLTLNAYPNTSSWLDVGGRSMDCALDYGDVRQR